MIYTVRYDFGPYTGLRDVAAEDGAQAIRLVKAWCGRLSSMPMVYQNYKVVNVKDA